MSEAWLSLDPPLVALAPQPAISSATLRPPARAAERRPLAAMVMCILQSSCGLVAARQGWTRRTAPRPWSRPPDHNVALSHSVDQIRNRYETSPPGAVVRRCG